MTYDKIMLTYVEFQDEPTFQRWSFGLRETRTEFEDGSGASKGQPPTPFFDPTSSTCALIARYRHRLHYLIITRNTPLCRLSSCDHHAPRSRQDATTSFLLPRPSRSALSARRLCPRHGDKSKPSGGRIDKQRLTPPPKTVYDSGCHI